MLLEPLEDRRVLAVAVDQLRLFEDTGKPNDLITANPTIAGQVFNGNSNDSGNDILQLAVDLNEDRLVDDRIEAPWRGGPFVYDPRDTDPALKQYTGPIQIAVRAEISRADEVIEQSDWVTLDFQLDPNETNRPPFVATQIKPLTVRGNENEGTVSLVGVFDDPDEGDAEKLVLTVNGDPNPPFTAEVDGGDLKVKRRDGDDRSGQFTVLVTATDPGDLSTQAMAVITLMPRNTPPYVSSPISDIIQPTSGAGVVFLDLTQHFRDDDPGIEGFLSFRVNSNTGPEWLTVESLGDGWLRMSTAAGDGSARVTVSAYDIYNESATTAFRVATFADNRPPQRTNTKAVASMLEDSRTTLDVAAWVVDPDTDRGDHLTTRLLHNSAPDIVDLQFLAGSHVVTGLPDKNGVARLTLRVEDDAARYVDVMATVSVRPTNDPLYTIQPNVTLGVDEDQQDVSLDLLTVFGDVDLDNEGDQFQYVIESNSAESLVSPSFAGDTLRLPLAPDRHGVADLVISATDRGGVTAQANVRLIVFSVVDPPRVVKPLGSLEVDEDAEAVEFDIADVFMSPEGLPLQVALADGGDSELVTTTLTDDRLQVVFAADRHGATNVRIRATDSKGAASDDNLAIRVRSVNDPPEAIAATIPFAIPEDAAWRPLDLSKWFVDADAQYGDQLSFSVSSLDDALVEHRWRDGRLEIRPLADRYGKTRGIVQAKDLADETADAELVVDVAAVDDSPRLSKPFPDRLQTRGDDDVIIPLNDHFVEPDGEPIQFEVNSSLPSAVEVAVVGGRLTIDISDTNSGVADIRVTATDPNGNQAEDDFEVIVNAKPVAPGSPPILLSEDGGPLTISLNDLFEDDDIPRWETALITTARVLSGDNVIDADLANSEIKLTPLPNQNGGAEVELTATAAHVSARFWTSKCCR